MLKNGSIACGFAVLLGGSIRAQVTERVSVTSAGAEADSTSTSPSISADGRYVAFDSLAANLVGGDTNGVKDVFVRDRQLGITERVSISSAGLQGDGNSVGPVISSDGRYVTFLSRATNLVGGDTNGRDDVFVRDRVLGITERVSVSTAGAQADQNGLGLASISADGRYVVFASQATNLVAGDTNGLMDAFVRDRQSGTTERVNVTPGGTQADAGTDFSVSISSDGRYVAFASSATDLVAGDANGAWDVFVRDLQLGITGIASLSSGGAQAHGNSGYPKLSADGRYVTFTSLATDIVAGDTNALGDLFVRDRQLGITERVNVSSAGAQADDVSYGPSPISPDGRYVTFASRATNLAGGSTGGWTNVYSRDRISGTTERVSVSSAGPHGNGQSFGPSMSADGRYVAFHSDAPNLVAGDTNGVFDAFVRDRSGAGFTSLCDPGANGVIACPCQNPPSGAGRGCDNSSSTGGAQLAPAGSTLLSSDSLVFTTTGQKPAAASMLVQGTAAIPGGAVYGQGVRCVGGSISRLYTRGASGGSITAPDFGSGEPPVSVRSAALGDSILAGESRWYLVFYRDATVLGGCPPASNFNVTQTVQVTWGQ